MTAIYGESYKWRVLKAATRFISQPCKKPVSITDCSNYYSVNVDHVNAIVGVIEYISEGI